VQKDFCGVKLTELRADSQELPEGQELPALASESQELLGPASESQELPDLASEIWELPGLASEIWELPGLASVCKELPGQGSIAGSCLSLAQLPGAAWPGLKFQELPGLG